MTTKWPRRFCCQHDSLCSLQNGASLPLLTTVMLLAGRQAQRDRPSRGGATIAQTEVVFGGAALVAVTFDGDADAGPALHIGRIRLQQRSVFILDRRLIEIEKTSRKFLLTSSGVIRAKSSSSLKVRGVVAAAGGVGGGGGAGGAAGAAGATGGGGVTAGAFFPQAAIPRPNIRQIEVTKTVR